MGRCTATAGEADRQQVCAFHPATHAHTLRVCMLRIGLRLPHAQLHRMACFLNPLPCNCCTSLAPYTTSQLQHTCRHKAHCLQHQPTPAASCTNTSSIHHTCRHPPAADAPTATHRAHLFRSTCTATRGYCATQQHHTSSQPPPAYHAYTATCEAGRTHTTGCPMPISPGAAACILLLSLLHPSRD